MQMENKIVIFGATGGTGQELIKQALKVNHKVTAFVRNPEKIKLADSKLTVIHGNVLNYQEVLHAVDNQDAVFVALSASPSDKTKLRTKATANIIKAMEEKGVQRLLCISALGVADSKPILPWYYTKFIIPFMLKNVYRDHESQETEIERSSLKWTIIRPSVLTDGPKTENYEHGFTSRVKLKYKISRADIAHFMLSQIDNNQYLMKKVCVSN
jgi:putative NADH-flavin reductase